MIISGHGIGQNFKNPRLVYKNSGNGQFKDVSSAMGPNINERLSSRGAAFGDYDNDGDIDALILNMNDVPSLLRNDGGNKQNWIKLKLISNKVQSHRDRRPCAGRYGHTLSDR